MEKLHFLSFFRQFPGITDEFFQIAEAGIEKIISSEVTVKMAQYRLKHFFELSHFFCLLNGPAVHVVDPVIFKTAAQFAEIILVPVAEHIADLR